jgi:hypothetical protein
VGGLREGARRGKLIAAVPGRSGRTWSVLPAPGRSPQNGNAGSGDAGRSVWGQGQDVGLFRGSKKGAGRVIEGRLHGTGHSTGHSTSRGGGGGRQSSGIAPRARRCTVAPCRDLPPARRASALREGPRRRSAIKARRERDRDARSVRARRRRSPPRRDGRRRAGPPGRPREDRRTSPDAGGPCWR